ncbi:MAG TPA: aldose epimerase family protein [Candidatus Solibacter sp.]|nr:aldose epimerase family protein [Candidatus Solibacter sp.]
MTKLSSFLCFLASIWLVAICNLAAGVGLKVRVSDFGKTSDGTTIHRYTLSNKNGMEALVISYGATLVSLKVPDRTGEEADVVLGYDTLDGYEQGKSFFGGTIGRYGNRIAHGEFTLDGTLYHLPKNDGPNSLHGGTTGLNKRIWEGVDRSTADAQILELRYTCPDGEEGFPGTLKVTVTYTLPTESNELRIDYLATTDKDTVLNLTNHSYYNLSGDPSKQILGHLLLLRALEFTPVDGTLIPTGELRPVHGTPFDFTKPTALGARIHQDDEQLKFGKGYDHNWVLEKTKNGGLQLAAEVYEPVSGRILDVLTTERGIQFYSGNFLDGTAIGKGGVAYGHRTGFCLETQHFPDSPNHPKFPSTELKPGHAYRSTTVLRFSTRR